MILVVCVIKITSSRNPVSTLTELDTSTVIRYMYSRWPYVDIPQRNTQCFNMAMCTSAEHECHYSVLNMAVA